VGGFIYPEDNPMFAWLRRLRPEPEALVFLRALDAAETPSVSFSQYASYMHQVMLSYPSVVVELRYNSIRHEWRLEVYDQKTYKSLYGYYRDWSAPDHRIVEFLRGIHDIGITIDRMIANAAKKKKEDAAAAERTRRKFLKSS
jgi:hypothetical protein